MNKACLVILLLFILPGALFASGIWEESDIPDPPVQITLPPELVGEFEFVYESPTGTHDFYGTIIIYESNKYMWRSDHRRGREWGHVIKENDTYFFNPIGSSGYSSHGYYITEKTKLIFTESGFSFSSTFWRREFVTRRIVEESPSNENQELLE